MHRDSLRRRLPLLASVLSVAAVLAVCASTSSMAAAASPSTAGALSARPKPKHKPKPHRVSNPLSGTWKGQYGGAFSGTFTLHWTQTGSSLKGMITLNPGGTLDCNGSVHGSTITFGTVGGPGITYTGSVSGNKSMSGNYNTPRGGGSWSAAKS